jgi:hypothetical protein
MKRIGLLGAGVAAMACVAMPSAHAAQYSIKASTPFVGRGVTNTGFTHQSGSCDTATLNTVNGIDGIVVPVTWAPTTMVTVRYSGTVVTAVSRLAPSFLTSTCTPVLPAVITGGIGGATMTVQVPAGVRWFMLEAIDTANVTVTITP